MTAIDTAHRIRHAKGTIKQESDMSGLKGPGSNRGHAPRRREVVEAEPIHNDDEPTRGRPGARRVAEPRRPEPKRAQADNRVVVILDDIDPKKGSVRFNTSDKDAAVTSIYVNKSGIPNLDYNRVRLTLEFLTADDDD